MYGGAHFGWRARDEQINVQKGDLEIQREGAENLSSHTVTGSKTRSGADCTKRNTTWSVIKRDIPKFDTVSFHY